MCLSSSPRVQLLHVHLAPTPSPPQVQRAPTHVQAGVAGWSSPLSHRVTYFFFHSLFRTCHSAEQDALGTEAASEMGARRGEGL